MAQQVSKIKIIHATSAHTYLMESQSAEKLAEILRKNSAVEEVVLSTTSLVEQTKYNHWAPSSKSEEWIRAAQEQMSIKLVPCEKNDGKQPEDSALMMAMYTYGKEILIAKGNPKGPSVIHHKVLS